MDVNLNELFQELGELGEDIADSNESKTKDKDETYAVTNGALYQGPVIMKTPQADFHATPKMFCPLHQIGMHQTSGFFDEFEKRSITNMISTRSLIAKEAFALFKFAFELGKRKREEEMEREEKGASSS